MTDPTDWVAGVDGCRGGWVVALARRSLPQPLRFRFCTAFADVLKLPERPAAIAIDMPIGLFEVYVQGGRPCDREARRLLGRPRASSVFSPPARVALPAMTGQRKDYARAKRLNGGHLTLQAFFIGNKIREVDETMTPARQRIVFEAHPELAFRTLAGRALAAGKITKAGQRQRRALLERAFGKTFVDPEASRRQLAPHAVRLDDILDACVLCLVAGRIARGRAGCVPREPIRDARGLRMEIRY